MNHATSTPARADVSLGHGDILRIRPMDAVLALYSDDHLDVAEAIIASLGHSVFGKTPSPAGSAQRAMARVVQRLLTWTTSRHASPDDKEAPVQYRNRLLERSQHPYAQSLLASSKRETEGLVEGGDPMNGPYMMLAPEIRETCTVWDRIFFNSVLGKDVQLRFIWETNATYELASRRIEREGSVRIKALAAGTGLSLILAYDRLLRDGCDPGCITAHITDRDDANTTKTNRLLSKLAARRGWKLAANGDTGIEAFTEDIFTEAPVGLASARGKYDILTAVGILEYLQGFTCETTERHHGMLEEEDAANAIHLAEILAAMSEPDASLVVNTYRPHASTRILEIFGKRFDYRRPEHLVELLATAGFRPARIAGSGVVYDVKIYEKIPPAAA